LRAERSLIQTIGRAARNAEGKVILYADVMTRSMQNAIRETERRRTIQTEYNRLHGIIPKTVVKGVRDVIEVGTSDEKTARKKGKDTAIRKLSATEREKRIVELTSEMKEAARRLEFEQAAFLRDRIKELRETGIESAPKRRR